MVPEGIRFTQGKELGQLNNSFAELKHVEVI